MTIEQLYSIYIQNPSIQTDTRKIKSGDIFFALKGPTFDGNLFANRAFELGASYVVIDDADFVINDKCVLVDNVLDTLQQLAKYHRLQFQIPFIAITGSNGKTTSKELLYAVLSQKFKTYATEGNLNNHIGIPLTILKIKPDAEMAIIEMGANHQKEIESYCNIVLPNFGIINNCGKAHIEGFGGLEGVRKGKGELFDFIRENSGSVFINNDLPYLAEMANGIGNQYSYGTRNADLIGYILDASLQLNISVLAGEKEIKVQTKLVGDYNLPNVLLAFAVGTYFGVDITQIKRAIEAYEPDNSRSQLLVVDTNQIILDAYNANPTSMRAAIQNFASLIGDKELWLGAMKEMGEDEDFEHRELISFIQEWKWKDVILVGKEFEKVKGPFLWFENSEIAALFVAKNKPQNSMILIKGSRGSKMEKMFEALS